MQAKGFCLQSRFRKGEADLEPHLDADQIDVLLRSAWGLNAETLSEPDPFELSGLGLHEDAHAHLMRCESCQERVLEQKKAMERLALLRPNAPVARSPECPPEDVWMEVAAGIARRSSEIYLSHAVECDHCGQMLSRAAEDFVEELTPQEEVLIANLPSSTLNWQTRLANQLRSTRTATADRPHAIGVWFSSIAASLTPSRLAFAAALAGIMVLGLRDYSLSRHLSSQSLQATADVQLLEQDVLQQKAQIADLTAKLNSPLASSAQMAPRQGEEPSIASVVLESGLTRSAGEMKRLSVPAGTELVRITLHIPDSPGGVMREELLNFDRRKIWSQELEASAAETKSRSLSIFIPAYLLKPDDYLIKLSRESQDRFDEVATYSFRVPR